MSEEHNPIDQQLQQLAERSEQLFQECRLRSALQLAKEASRLARGHGRVVQYMHGLFDQMRFGHGLLDPKLTRAAAVELVVLLEDEEQARRIQPDLDEGHYHWVCSWMSSCAYDNLAEATGLMAGFNSAGLHACINDGIQVCRQTGKLECVKCFREYAADVYLAADDLAMVRCQCQPLLEYREENDQRDRRWSALLKMAWVNVLEGRLTRAAAELNDAQHLCQAENVYLKLRAAWLVRTAAAEVRILLGQPLPESLFAQPGLELPEAGQWPRIELDLAKVEALQAVTRGDYEQGAAMLTVWDRRLTEQHCLREWFEVRLRLIAAYLLAENRSRAEALAKGLEAQAHQAQDYLTIRRLKRLLDPAAAVCPIPLLEDAETAAPAGSALAAEVSRESVQDDPQAETDDVQFHATPLSETLSRYMQEIVATQDDQPARAILLNELLSHTVGNVTEASDAAYLVHLARFVIDGTAEALRVWPWALGLRSAFPDDATVQSIVAALGQFFRSVDPETFDPLIPIDALEKWFRLSLALNASHPRNFARAGEFFYDAGNLGEAERCFSRAFRLERVDGAAARRLAEIYRETDRPRDALTVLDLCLREGTRDADVAWEAAMTALQLDQHDALLTYLDRFSELAETGQTWLHYYRALAQFHLGQLDDCLQELQRELEYNPPGRFHLHALRTCVLEKQGEREAARGEIRKLLRIRLADVDYLSLHGLVRLADLLCSAISDWPLEDPLRRKTARRLLKAGLLSDGFLDALRQQNPESDGLRFFRVQLRQALDASWPESEGCLAGQAGWKEYLIDWGVLAETEREAVERVLELQSVCEKTRAQVVHVESSDEAFRDKPGVVWQGYRRCEALESDHDHDHDETESDE